MHSVGNGTRKTCIKKYIYFLFRHDAPAYQMSVTRLNALGEHSHILLSNYSLNVQTRRSDVDELSRVSCLPTYVIRVDAADRSRERSLWTVSYYYNNNHVRAVVVTFSHRNRDEDTLNTTNYLPLSFQ